MNQGKFVYYIYSKTNNILTTGGTHTVEAMQYFDGLGRPLQTINYKASPTQKDIIQSNEYDQYGREAIRYLPYAASDANGTYRSGWKTAQSTFNSGIYGSDDGSKAYSQTLFENSPLNRVIKQGAPGVSWQPDMSTPGRVQYEHVTSYQYASNATDIVYYWNISGVYPNVITFARQTYSANTLFKNIITDENGKPVTEYKDKQGKVVLKTDALGGKTYYIYDDFELLRCVIPPLASQTLAASTKTSFTWSETDFQELCYYYEYDFRQRMTKKKLPGTIGIYEMTYDNLDRLIETKDPKGITINTTYDVFSRPIDTKNKTTGQWLTKTHYDSYVKNGINYTTDFPYDITIYGYTKEITYKGKVTVTVTKVLNPLTGMKDSLRSVFYYDKYGRVIQTVSENHKGTIDRVSYQYKYKNSDLITQTKIQHGISGASISQTVTETNSYDHIGRIISTSHSINGQTPTMLSSIIYNEAGHMIAKNMGSNLQYPEYKYNIRGWLTQINNPDIVNSAKLFNLKLEYIYYNNSNNITYMTWNNVDGINKKYYFSYDNLNRLTSAYFYSPTVNKYSESYTYDANGNIMTAKRYGLLQDGSGLQGLIDDLTYKYFNGEKSNRLWAVGDNAADVSGRGDFLELMNSNGTASQEYYYDNNGNMTSDANKLLSITYNCLNLPQSTSQYSNITTNYSYKATGEKIGSKYTEGSTSTKMEYIGPFVYKNDVLDYIITGEGRAVCSSGAFSYYEYHLKDHLGNVRVAFKKSASNTAEVVQKNDYYPFGLLMAERTDNATNKNKYLYNGKEFQQDGMLQMYDYGARMYDPQLGRWHSVDPKAEKYYSNSPYDFVGDNPIVRIDPNGKDWFYYKAKGEENKTWHWQEGNKATYTNAKGKEVTTRNGYDYLVTYQHTGKNAFGASTGTITVYNQNQVAFAQKGVFSGSGWWTTLQKPSKGGFEPAGKGNYMLSLGNRSVMPNNQKVKEGVTNPTASYGIQQIPEGTNLVYPDGSTHNVNADYGAGRIRMNPLNDNLQPSGTDRGYYVHGKDQWWNFRTHGCVCDKTDNTFNYFWSGDGSDIRTNVPMAVDMPVVVP